MNRTPGGELPEAKWWHRRDKVGIQCDLCPHRCVLAPNKTGLCGVRQSSAQGDALLSLNFGLAASMNLDPVEKKPLYHWHPGTRIFSVGTVGCNLRCPFCQNWPLVEMYEDIPDIEWLEIESYLIEHRDFIDGFVITGGEPFVSDFLFDIIEKIKSIGIAVKIDTNGTFPDKLKYLIENELIRGVSMDVKDALEAEFYSRICGITITLELMEKIIESTKILMNSKIDYEFRTTLVRKFHTIDNLKKIGVQLKGARKYVLQQYRSIGVKDGFDGGDPFSREEMLKFQDVLSEFFQKCDIRYYGTDT